MRKIVLNKCYGGFGISRKALDRMRELGNEIALKETLPGEKYADGSGPYDPFGKEYYSLHEIDRTDAHLVQAVEELGEGANGPYAHLEVLEIPEGEYEISDYDGIESVGPPSWG